MVNEDRNGVDGGYPILVGAKPNNTPRGVKAARGRETDRWQVYRTAVSEPTTASLDSFRFVRRPQSG